MVEYFSMTSDSKEGPHVESQEDKASPVLVNSQESTVPNLSEDPINPKIFLMVKAPRFSPRAAVVELTRYSVTGAISFFSSSALEGVALVGATLAAGINPLAGQDSKLAITALALSYMPLVTGALQNAHATWKSLRETGASVSFLAKVGYDVSRRLTDSERIQKAATYIGFTALELMKEIPWYVGAFGSGKLVSEVSPEHYTPNVEYAFLAGANIFGAGYQYAQAGAVEGILRGIKNGRRIVNIFRRNSERS